MMMIFDVIVNSRLFVLLERGKDRSEGKTNKNKLKRK